MRVEEVRGRCVICGWRDVRLVQLRYTGHGVCWFCVPEVQPDPTPGHMPDERPHAVAWPDAIAELGSQTIGPFTDCEGPLHEPLCVSSRMSDVGHTLHGGTWVRYGGLALCYRCVQIATGQIRVE